MDRTTAEHLATEWVAAWNARDLPRVLAHYTPDFEMQSPLIVTHMGEPSGTLTGQAAVGAYWAKALTRVPDLHFTLQQVLVGANSVTLYYRNQRGQSCAEILYVNAAGLVYRAAAHYA